MASLLIEHPIVPAPLVRGDRGCGGGAPLIMLSQPPIPQLTPVMRRRMKETFPTLRDEDLPVVEMSEADLVDRIARRTGRAPGSVRRLLYKIGVFVAPRVAVERAKEGTARSEESVGSGVPDDTGQSGLMSLGPGW